MPPPESRRHHFVPKLLLRPWLLPTGPAGQLRGYFWDPKSGELRVKERGLNAFCFQVDLLTLRAHSLGRDALERIFFGEIDTKGAIARQRLLESGPSKLTTDERFDFVRLLLSLETRRPGNVSAVRDHAKTIIDSMNSDPEILDAAAEAGLVGVPAEAFEAWTGVSIHDRILGVVQKLTDNPRVGGRVAAADWFIKRLGPNDGALVLADRPLIRFHGYDGPGSTWILPLEPKAAFISANHRANLDRIKRCSPARFARLTNVSSANQAERFVFSVDERDAHWLGKYLRKPRAALKENRAASGPPGFQQTTTCRLLHQRPPSTDALRR